MMAYIRKLLNENRIFIPALVIGFMIFAAVITVILRIGPTTDFNIREYESINELSGQVREDLLAAVEAGLCQMLETEGRYFVVLSTGGPSSGDFEYKTEIGADGTRNLYWRLTDQTGEDMRVRYKLLEVSENINVVEMPDTGTDLSGMARMIYVKKGGGILYNVESGEAWENEMPIPEGVYTFTFKSGEIQSRKICPDVKLEQCEITEKVSQKVYRITLPGSSVTLDVFIKDVNVEAGAACNLLIQYENGFIGTICE